MSDAERTWGFAQITSTLILAFLCLGAIGLSYQGLWIIGAPIALITGIMLIRTILGRTRWRGGDAGAGGPGSLPSTRDLE
ncbi:MAG: hypothetical protein AAGK00_19035 [Pseudomonadota bacterium]